MGIILSGTTGIDMGNKPISNASQLDSIVINENGENVATTSNLTGFKNYIINGNFDVWQRGTSQTSSGYGSDDRWANNNVGSTKTHSQVACTDVERALFNASYFSRTVVSSIAGANNRVDISHTIENITKLAGKTVTISFWAKADSNKNIFLELEQYCGSGGSTSGYIFMPISTVALTTTWQKKTITLTIPSIVGKTLGTDGVHTSYNAVRFWLDAGSLFNSRTTSLGQQSGTFDIAQVQLEEGSIATPFEQRPYGLELSLCQRYYEVVRGQPFAGQTVIYDANNLLVNFNYNVIKRVLPTVTNIDSTNQQTLVIHRSLIESVSCKCSSGDINFSVISASAEL